MKTTLLVWLACIINSLATPDWNSTTSERFIGSNDLAYASIKTTNDNQGSYYSWRETKRLVEYSKLDNSVINIQIISDILYSINPEHIDPNTKPKVTQKEIELDTKVLLSEVIKKYHLPTQPTSRPEWLKKLSWKKQGLYLEDKLLILPSMNQEMEDHPAAATILKVHTDRSNIILSIQADETPDSGNYLFCIPAGLSKQINDWAKKLPEYLFIEKFDNKQQANDLALKLNQTSQEKNFFGFNPEIWSTRTKTGKVVYLLVHQPSHQQMTPEDIAVVERAIDHKLTPISSDTLIEKWIPFSAVEDEEEKEESIEDPEELKQEEELKP